MFFCSINVYPKLLMIYLSPEAGWSRSVRCFIANRRKGVLDGYLNITQEEQRVVCLASSAGFTQKSQNQTTTNNSQWKHLWFLHTV
jgi:hypothetical protein